MKNLRNDFPILKEKLNGHSLIYFDNAATTQKPQQVIDALVQFYTKYNANIDRSVHAFGERATSMYEAVRQQVADFIGARDASEIIFTRGTTESINFIAATWAREHIVHGDEILLSELEHHSNLVPWQQVAQHKGATLRFIPVLGNGLLDMEQLPNLLTSKTKLVAITQTSNALGTQVDIATIIKKAHKVGARVLIDAAQSIPHKKVDVQKLDCDFLAFSGHKMLAPTGVGVLYIKKELHNQTPPYQFGGGMIFDVDFHNARWRQAPHKFQAGTPAIAQVIGFGAAIDYYNNHIDFAQTQKHEAQLTARAIDGLRSLNRVRFLGPVDQLHKAGHMVSFVVDGIHAHDVAAYLSNAGICVRAGHHCAQPLAQKFDVLASVRASFFFYNTKQEVDTFLQVMRDMRL